ncbi:HutD/Ves family protein [Microbacterium sp. BR1]|uniref:HutD/Ves family protein n=1 Tax=Microbacterium sp. BR1 TaxID=1070896 RepID=UPI000C2CAC00|nr:HutD family protein [Microbacterium sp. BR1]
MRILRADERTTQPWANGRGVTSEVATHMSTAPSGWDWRVSIATVADGGPFSAFPGHRRLLTPLDGSLSLRVDGRVRELRPHEVLEFDGQSATCVRRPARPRLVLNVIFAPTWGGAVLAVSGKEDRGGAAPGLSEWVIVLALHDGAAIGGLLLGRLDAVLFEPGEKPLDANDSHFAVARMTANSSV